MRLQIELPKLGRCQANPMQAKDVAVVGVSVAEALRIAPLDQAKVVAGAGGLGRKIRGVGVMEAPDIATWVKGNELILTTGFFIKDSPWELGELVRAIHGQGAAALGVNVDRWMKELPPEVLRVAEELGFPLLLLPSGLPWLDIITPLMNEVFVHHGQLVHHRLIQAALRGGTVPIVTETAELLHRPVAMFENDMRLAAFADPAETMERGLAASWFVDHPDGRALWEQMLQWEKPLRRVSDPMGSGEVLLLPLRFSNSTHGLLVVWAGTEPLDRLGMLTIEHAGTILTLELQKLRSLHEVGQRYQDEFILDLLFGHYKSSEELINRGRLYGVDLSGARTVLIMDLESPLALGRQDPDLRDKIVATATWTLRAQSLKSTWVVLNDSLVVLMDEGAGGRHGQRAQALAQSLLTEVCRVLSGVETTIGIGTLATEPRQVTRSFEEARHALTMGKLLWGPGRLFHFKDMGIYQLILKDRSPEQLLRFKESVLGPLAREDETIGRLLDTLEIYLDASNSVSATAARMFIHTNTVKYRLGRVRALLHEDLSAIDVRLRLMVALKIRRIEKQGALHQNG